ncbi:nucleotidyltransferase family protein [Streptomyces sp. V4-01]|uniref:Nucleotidyltransferase family protein n=1 Tax=Actinacidiphila polyblastidii TaxID=3110430 RepID=A0ABU7PA44_9ACTN|nr:nucleotidyltransferase family protein [Streptomyces sp. V4-01]
METKSGVAGLLLAAGGGRRLGGRPKALLVYRDRPLVEHAVAMLRAGGCGPVHVVLGAAAREVRERADLTDCVVVENPQWTQGMGSSLRLGLASLAAAERPPAATVIALVDQPGVGGAAVARVVAAARAGEDLPSALASAMYEGRRGHPVLIGASRWAGVACSAGEDRGARTYLREHAGQTLLVECGDVADPADIDTPADLRLLDAAARRATKR